MKAETAIQMEGSKADGCHGTFGHPVWVREDKGATREVLLWEDCGNQVCQQGRQLFWKEAGRKCLSPAPLSPIILMAQPVPLQALVHANSSFLVRPALGFQESPLLPAWVHLAVFTVSLVLSEPGLSSGKTPKAAEAANMLKRLTPNWRVNGKKRKQRELQAGRGHCLLTFRLLHQVRVRVTGVTTSCLPYPESHVAWCCPWEHQCASHPSHRAISLSGAEHRAYVPTG